MSILKRKNGKSLKNHDGKSTQLMYVYCEKCGIAGFLIKKGGVNISGTACNHLKV